MRHLFNCGAIAHPGLLQDRKQMCAAQYERPIIDDSRRVARTAPAAQDLYATLVQ
jgi:hypothetical protein